MAGESVAHDVGADGAAHAPEAVQPAHVAGCVVERYIVVQGGVHRAGTQTVGNGPEAEQPEGAADGKAEQCRSGEKDADSSYKPRTESAREAVGEQAGQNGAAGDQHCDNAHIGHGHLQILMHNGPRGADQGIRQSQTDECNIYDDQQY